eukprot:3720656-Rhodomonas_salina.1
MAPAVCKRALRWMPGTDIAYGSTCCLPTRTLGHVRPSKQPRELGLGSKLGSLKWGNLNRGVLAGTATCPAAIIGGGGGIGSNLYA